MKGTACRPCSARPARMLDLVHPLGARIGKLTTDRRDEDVEIARRSAHHAGGRRHRGTRDRDLALPMEPSSGRASPPGSASANPASTGGKQRLGRPREGQRDIRRLLIIGAMAVVRWASRKGAGPGSRMRRGSVAAGRDRAGQQDGAQHLGDADAGEDYRIEVSE